jgi:membrane protease YdiL (CAAX protease family)
VCFGVAAIILAPAAEEALFRGILYSFLKQQGRPRLALFGTSLLFAASHVNMVTFVPLACFALFLVFVYEKTDTLLAPIVTHALFNAANFSFVVFESELTRMYHRLFGWLA